MRLSVLVIAVFALVVCFTDSALAQKKKKPAEPQPSESEDAYYKLHAFTIPEGEVLEGGALETLPLNKIAFGTRRGEIWIIEDGLTDNPRDAKFTRFAHGLHEILGLAYKNGWLYVTQRCDVTRIKDSTGKGKKADTFEVVTDGWEISGDYHEYALGSRFDKNGNIWVTLCLTGSFTSNVKFRGWGGKVTPDGKFVPTTSGVRSPGGVGFNAEGDVFYTDNQGPWNGPCGLKHLAVGGFVGHPGGFKWYDDPAAKYLGPTPPVPKVMVLEKQLADAEKQLKLLREKKMPSTDSVAELAALTDQVKLLQKQVADAKINTRMMDEAKRIPQLYPTCVMFPYGKMGQSAAGIDCDLSGGKFGPFEKQLFVGDQTHSITMRVTLEKVNGKYQGACYPFRQGHSCGIVPVCFASDGSLIVGGTARGWGSRGGKPYSIERLAWTGKVPFEIHEMKAEPNGFTLNFTKAVDPKTAGNAASYKMETYTYIYRAEYGSPEVDQTKPTITRVTVAPDNKSARIWLSKLEEGHVHQLTAAGVRSAEGTPLLHNVAYYTLNYIPAK